MDYKVGDKVKFDWSKDINKFDITTDSMRQIRKLYGDFTSKAFTIKRVGATGLFFTEIDNFFKKERFKKVSEWNIKFRKEVKCV